MIVLSTHIVPEGVANIRLQEYVVEIFSDIISSKSGLKKAIKKGEVFIDGVTAEGSRFIVAGQKIELADLENTLPKMFKHPLEVVFENESFALINKTAGIVVSGNQHRTIANALLYNIKPSKEKDALKLPRPVHRLDAPTSGLLLIAKTRSALIKLSKQFQDQKISKKYRAIVIGKIPEEMEFDNPVFGKEAYTKCKRIAFVPSLKNTYLSLVELQPLTGRTHQLRIHLAETGFPILGDKTYGKEGAILKKKGLFLASIGMSLNDPISDERLFFEISEPKKYQNLLEREAKRWEKFNS